MAAATPGGILRDLQQAQAGMKKARQLLTAARGSGGAPPAALDAVWASLARTHHLLAELPRAAADDAVLTRQLSVQRHATALLVRYRRAVRGETGGGGDASGSLDEEFEGDVEDP